MKRTIYHGSKMTIEKPVFGKGNPHNDYGLGFYCTEDLIMAHEWAVSEKHDGYANQYLLDDTDLKLLDLSNDQYSVLHWLTILLQNRIFNIQTDFGAEAKAYLTKHFLIDYENADIIKGYRADDSYFSFAQDFLNNAISLSTLSEAMRLGRLGEQIVLKSEKAFARLDFQQAHFSEKSIWFAQKEARDQSARKDYFVRRKRPWKKGELYMMQILEQEIKADDVRIRS